MDEKLLFGMPVRVHNFMPEDGFAIISQEGDVLAMGMFGKYSWATTDRDKLAVAKEMLVGNFERAAKAIQSSKNTDTGRKQ